MRQITRCFYALLAGGSFVAPALCRGIAVGAFFLFGVSHGALDYEGCPRKLRFEFVIDYLTCVFAYVALWMIYPPAALFVLLALSADHFGGVEFLKDGRPSISKFLSSVWGAAVIALPFLFHWPQCEKVVSAFVGRPLPPIDPASLRFAGFAVAIAVPFVYLLTSGVTSSGRWRGFFQSLALFLSFAFVSPFISMTGFFCFWHSSDAISEQSRERKHSYREFFLRAAPTTVIAVAGIVSFAWFNDLDQSSANGLARTVVALGGLAVAHARAGNSIYDSGTNPSASDLPVIIQ